MKSVDVDRIHENTQIEEIVIKEETTFQTKSLCFNHSQVAPRVLPVALLVDFFVFFFLLGGYSKGSAARAYMRAAFATS